MTLAIITVLVFSGAAFKVAKIVRERNNLRTLYENSLKNEDHSQRHLMRIIDKQAKQIEELQETVQSSCDYLDPTKQPDALDIANYIQQVNPIIPEETATSIGIAVKRTSALYGVPIPLIIGMIETESHFNPQAIGSSGERGLMQVHPKFWLHRLKLKDRFSLHGIFTGIESGVRILRYQLDKNNGDLRKALVRYNGAKIYADKIYEAAGRFLYISHIKKALDFKSPTDLNLLEPEKKGTVIIHHPMDNSDDPIEYLDDVTTYTIKAGDTLSAIALEYYGSYNDWYRIQQANPDVDPLRLQIGSTIIIP